LAVFFLSVGWGVLDEYHQRFVPTRESSGLDLLADAAGAAAAVLLVGGLAHVERRRT
ncbi:MAG TPA: VanZ family protein, partial [Thermoanaerobaculia bacterium]|nr:VanZ family protein [Thermoanaerobaculia bacterium]